MAERLSSKEEPDDDSVAIGRSDSFSIVTTRPKVEGAERSELNWSCSSCEATVHQRGTAKRIPMWQCNLPEIPDCILAG